MRERERGRERERERERDKYSLASGNKMKQFFPFDVEENKGRRGKRSDETKNKGEKKKDKRKIKEGKTIRNAKMGKE